MKKRTVKITLTFDMDDIPEDLITPAEEVSKLVTRDMNYKYSWDENFRDVNVEVIDE